MPYGGRDLLIVVIIFTNNGGAIADHNIIADDRIGLDERIPADVKILSDHQLLFGPYPYTYAGRKAFADGIPPVFNFSKEFIPYFFQWFDDIHILLILVRIVVT